jgi:hypothetical protein
MSTTDRDSRLLRQTHRSRASLDHKKVGRRPYDIVALSLRLAAIALLGSTAWIHLHLWQSGYRHIPTIGPLFLAAALSASVVAAALLGRPSRLIATLALAVDAGILLSLIGSINVGLFGFTESLNAPFVVESVVIETLAALAIALWVVVDRIAHNRQEPVNPADAAGRLNRNVGSPPLRGANTEAAITRCDIPVPYREAPDGRRVTAAP